MPNKTFSVRYGLDVANTIIVDSNRNLSNIANANTVNLAVSETANANNLNVNNSITSKTVSLSGTGTAVDASQGNILTNKVTGTEFAFLNGLSTVTVRGNSAQSGDYTFRLPSSGGTNGFVLSTDGTGNTVWSNAIYQLSNGAYAQANGAYAQANGAYEQANGAYAHANIVYGQANTARDQANTARDQANTARTTANDAYGAANTAQTTAQNAYGQANSALTVGQNAYGQANAARDQANTARTTANDAYGAANTAQTTAQNAYGAANTAQTTAQNSYGQANTARDQANTARDTANGAYAQANGAYAQANGAYGQANGAYAHANIVYGQANAAYGQANTARGTANDAYGQANTATTNAGNAYGQANSARDQANTARDQANTAYGQANAAYAAANTKFSTSGGSISGDVFITGNLSVTGNATTFNISNLSVNDSIILLANGQVGDSNDIGFVGHFDRGATPTHAGLIRKATLNEFYLFDNYETEPTNNVIDITGQNFRLANIRLNTINANSVLILGSAAATQANLTLAHNQANTARTQANNAYDQANSAYGAANNRVLKAGDTMTGNLIMSAATINTSIANISTIVTGNALTLSTGTGSNSNVVISANGTEYVRVTNVGNVGIGTSNPTSNLHVEYNDNSFLNGIVLSNQNTGSSAQAKMAFTTDAGTLNIGRNSVSGGGQGFLFLNGSFPLTLTTNSLERMRIDSSGNVGIGTTSPGSKLHVVGDIIFGNNTVYTNLKLFSDTAVGSYNQTNSITPITTPGSGTATTALYLKNAVSGPGTNRMDLLVDGNVGIGTTSPSGNLQVSGANPRIRFSNTNGTASTLLFGADSGSMFLGAETNAPIYFITNNTERMRIDSSGNVGIGTTSPAARLEVSASFANSAIEEIARISRTGGDTSYTTGRAAAITFYDTPNPTLTAAIAGVRNAASGHFNGSLAFYTSNTFSSSATTVANLTQQMIITNTGAVGIGTTSPGSKLHVRDTAGGITIDNAGGQWTQMDWLNNGTAKMFIALDHTNHNFIIGGQGTYTSLDRISFRPDGSTDAFVIKRSGNLGIGTTSPDYKLTINTTQTALKIITTSASSGNPSIDLIDNGVDVVIAAAGGSSTGLIGTWSSHAFSIYTSNSPRLTVSSAGNVGIGTTSPTSTLHVAGNANVTTGITTSTINLQANSSIATNTFTTSSQDVTVTVDAFATATFRSAVYQAQLTRTSPANDHETITLSVIHDGSTVYLSQYGQNRTNASANMGTFDATITTGTLSLTFRPNVAAVTVKTHRNAITV